MRALVVVALVAACGGGAGEPDAIVLPPFDAPPPDVDGQWCGAGRCSPDCEAYLPCPSANNGAISVCGRLRDVETDQNIAGATSLAACEDGVAGDGGCAFSIRFYDALDYAGDPAGATPLAFQELRRDGCGRFAAQNIVRPQLGYLAIVVDDAATAPDDHRRTVVAISAASGQVFTRQQVYALRATTDAAWAAQIGLGGDTVTTDGALLALYLDDDDVPIAGVQLTPTSFYFSDTDLQTRSTIAPDLDATGVNGAALRIDTSIGGGEPPPGCTWQAAPLGAIPGVLVFQPIYLTCE